MIHIHIHANETPDPDDDVGPEETSLSSEVPRFLSKPGLRPLELSIKDGELGRDIEGIGFKPNIEGMNVANRRGTGPFMLQHKVKVITPAEAAFYSSGNSKKIGREEIVFIDLRRKGMLFPLAYLKPIS